MRPANWWRTSLICGERRSESASKDQAFYLLRSTWMSDSTSATTAKHEVARPNARSSLGLLGDKVGVRNLWDFGFEAMVW